MAGLRALVAALEAAGHTILTKHLLEDNVEGAESALTERAVYERDIEWLDACDILIADASGSSFGVGFEVGYVLGRSDRTEMPGRSDRTEMPGRSDRTEMPGRPDRTNQRVILLYRADRRDQISRLIVGNAHARCTVMKYENPDDLAVRVSQILTAQA